MDSITHVALGAVIGDALFGKKLGKKAMLIGAAAQSIPDIDFVDGIWLRPVDDLLAHRSFTHSIVFALLMGALIGWIAFRLNRRQSLPLASWMLFIGLEMSVHLLIDSFNCYGTGLLEPFSRERFSLNAVYVADPFFSFLPGVACVVLIFMRVDSKKRIYWARIPLLTTALYLVFAVIAKAVVVHDAKAELRDAEISYGRLLTTPAPLSSLLWFVAAETDSGYHVSYRSLFDGRDSIGFVYFLKNRSLANQLTDRKDLEKLIRFSQGYYTMERWGEDLIFNDLRFGQIAGWVDPHARFAFHYDLLHPDANMFVVQQGRFANWNRGTVQILLRRMLGMRPTGNSLLTPPREHE
ncbi:MAG TPA: metal-dependent hydrolase [Cyclobacteriaceae bacterium]|nr:metal-dependent hydrolase [Cyclobacteriaceae bacterium]